jgi:hypothetical protein
MSQFRQQIERAREQYRAARYRGDLAADVLPREPAASRRVSWRVLVAGGAVATALAAAFVLMTWLHRAAPPGPTALPPGESLAKMAPPPMPPMPADMPLTAPYEDLSSVPAMPSFPSFLGTL